MTVDWIATFLALVTLFAPSYLELDDVPTPKAIKDQ